MAFGSTHAVSSLIAFAFVLALPLDLVLKANAQTTHTVQVGAGGLSYSPSTVNANVGDVVTFAFQGPHTVTQSTFATPCALLTNNTGHVVGFDSGTGSPGGTYSVVVTDTAPIWFSCAIPGHCQAGMVGSINPPTSGNTFANFMANAKGAAGQTTAAAAIQGVTATGAGANPTSVGALAASASASGSMSSAAATIAPPPPVGPYGSTSGSAPTSMSFTLASVASALLVATILA